MLAGSHLDWDLRDPVSQLHHHHHTPVTKHVMATAVPVHCCQSDHAAPESQQMSLFPISNTSNIF